MKAVVVAHGEVDPDDAGQLAGADLVIAADGGTLHLEAWGVVPAMVVGDLDSLGSDALGRLRASGARIERWPSDKDASDTELALERAVAEGADEIVLLGAFGGSRVDHALANALLLAHERFRGRLIRAVRGSISARVLRAGEQCVLAGVPGDLVTLLPVGGAAIGIRTDGLRYPLVDGTLALGTSRGVSNEIDRVPAGVSCGEGTLLVVEVSSSQGAPPLIASGEPLAMPQRGPSTPGPSSQGAPEP